MRHHFKSQTVSVSTARLRRLGWLIWYATFVVGCSSNDPEPASLPRATEPRGNVSFLAVQPPSYPVERQWQPPHAQPHRYPLPQQSPYQDFPRYRPDSGRQAANPWASPNQPSGWPTGAPPTWQESGNPWGSRVYGGTTLPHYRPLDSSAAGRHPMLPESAYPGQYAGSQPPAPQNSQTRWPQQGGNRWTDNRYPKYRPTPFADP
jgi:hypothetical protein